MGSGTGSVSASVGASVVSSSESPSVGASVEAGGVASSVGVPSVVSYSAGAYVCNDVLYSLLARFDKTDVKVGFMHIPYSTEQNKTPSMDLGDIIKAITVAIETIGGIE